MKYVWPLFIISLVLNIKFFHENSELNEKLKFINDEVHQVQSSIKKSKRIPNRKPGNPIIEKIADDEILGKTEIIREEKSTDTEETFDEVANANQFVDIEQGWIEGLNEFMELELKLPAESFAKYMEIRVRR